MFGGIKARTGLGLLAALALGSLLSACGPTMPGSNPKNDLKTEARREQDCANPKWKAANLGLWYNLCQTTTY